MSIAIEIFEQIDNRSIGIYKDSNGTFTALTLSASKNFKTEKGARKWIAKYL